MIESLMLVELVLAPVIGLAVCIYLVLRPCLDYGNGVRGLGYLVVKPIVSIGVWTVASCGWLYAFFALAYRPAVFAVSEGSAGEALTLLIMDLVYAAIGCGLCWWVRSRPIDSSK